MPTEEEYDRAADKIDDYLDSINPDKFQCKRCMEYHNRIAPTQRLCLQCNRVFRKYGVLSFNSKDSKKRKRIQSHKGGKGLLLNNCTKHLNT